ncbi:hypothetical protein O9993_09500 [Vibrio lentus]|nr:hypothetical protein [Vibrio lentus]
MLDVRGDIPMDKGLNLRIHDQLALVSAVEKRRLYRRFYFNTAMATTSCFR